MAAPPPPPSNIGLRTILSESRRILRTHTRHFQALSVLFLLPVSLFLSIYPFIYQRFNPTIESHLSFCPSIKPFISILIYTLIVSIFSNFAVGSITHSVFNAFYGQPINLLSAIKAASTSFFPLLSTSLVQSFIISGINLILGLVYFSLLKATQSSAFFLLSLAYMIIVTLISLYLQVNWIFAYVIVVVESRWGAEPLERSRILVQGSKGVALKIILLFVFFILINIMQSIRINSAGHDWKSWDFILYIVATTTLSMVLMLYKLAADTVFYIYSKESAGEYTSLPFDDEKVPLVASIV